MKRLFLTLLLCLLIFCGIADARMLQGVAGAATTNNCSTATDYLGDKTDRTSNANWDTGYIYCYAFTAVCSGTTSCAANTGYVKHGNTDTDNVKLAIYVYGSATLNDASNTLIDYTSAITGNGSDVVYSASMTNKSTNLTNGTTYWMCAIPNTTNWAMLQSTATGATRVSSTCSNCYGTPPSNLSGIGEPTTTANRAPAAYITIGP